MLSHKLRRAAFNSGIYTTDFSEYPTGSAPYDWTEQFDVSDFSTSIETVAGSLSGKALRWTKTATSRHGLSWDKVPLAADVEILLRARAIEAVVVDGENIIGAYARGSGTDTTEGGYRAVVSLRSTNSLWAGGLASYVSGAGGNIGAGTYGPTPNYTTNSWFWMRFRVVGTSLSRKQWYSGSGEPGSWNETISNSAVTVAGWTGLHDASNNPNAEIDYFACSIARGSDPPLTIPVPL